MLNMSLRQQIVLCTLLVAVHVVLFVIAPN